MKKFLNAILLVTMLISCSIVFAQDNRDYIDTSSRKEVMRIRGTIQNIKDDVVTIKGENSAEMRSIKLSVNHGTHVLNGNSGNEMDIKGLSKGMAVTAYFDSVLSDHNIVKSKENANPPSRGTQYSNAYAIITGTDAQTTPEYFVVDEVVRSGNSTRILDKNGMQYVTISDANLASTGPLKRGQEILVWFSSNSYDNPNEGVASKVLIL